MVVVVLVVVMVMCNPCPVHGFICEALGCLYK
jgi:hypothetical protein